MTTPSVRKVMNDKGIFWDSQGILLIDFVTKQRTIDAASYLRLLKFRVKPVFHSKRRGQAVKSVCLLHNNAQLHIAAVTIGSLEKMH